ncbi:MAG: serine/threonine protein kinase [Deltaproteobacteria bacterium]|nr:serine/threonine protein kinase [Deltaproteobacteria bacterium]
MDEVDLAPARSPAPSTLDDAPLLARRLAAFGWASGIVQGISLLSVFPFELAARGPRLLLDPAVLLTVVALAGCVVLVFAGRLAGGSAARLRTIEATVVVGQALAFSPITYVGESFAYREFARSLGESPTLGVLLRHYGSLTTVMSFSVMLALRAALVPSSPRRTLALTSAAGVFTVAVAGFGLYPRIYPLTSTQRMEVGVMAAFWTVLGTACCVVISAVVYRLERDVRRARELGQYVLEEKLGEGGMGVVYRARHALLKRPVAIKFLASSRAGEHGIARFEREVQITARLAHPSTITIYDYGRTPEGDFFYAMELLDGMDLATLVERHGPQPPARVARVLEAICRSLAEAHEQDLVHRDIKPANVFLCRELGGQPDFVKVLDFGLVRETRDDRPEVTREGMLTGTPMYMAPEILISSERTSARSDLYAVGAVGYALLAGRELFDAKSVVEVLAAQLHEQPAPPSKRLGRALPAELEQLVLQCLEKDPARRPTSARAMADRLSALDFPEKWAEDEARAWWSRQGAPAASAKGEVDPNAPTVAVASGFDATLPEPRAAVR